MRPEQRSAALAGAAASEAVVLGRPDTREDKPTRFPRQDLATAWLVRRFGLLPRRAALIAGLAGIGGAR